MSVLHKIMCVRSDYYQLFCDAVFSQRVKLLFIRVKSVYYSKPGFSTEVAPLRIVRLPPYLVIQFNYYIGLLIVCVCVCVCGAAVFVFPYNTGFPYHTRYSIIPGFSTEVAPLRLVRLSPYLVIL